MRTMAMRGERSGGRRDPMVKAQQAGSMQDRTEGPPTLKALAYQGEVGCCHIDGPPLYMLDPATLNHCCRPAGNIDTVTMTNVPAFELPIAPAPGPRCCPAPAPAVVGCDSNGYPL
jgi:hypothetical protein